MRGLLVEMNGVSKGFPGVPAPADAGFELRSGEVHALVGENGAGKSTLMKILAGVYQPDAGEILIDRSPAQFSRPAEPLGHGIGIIYQELSLAGRLPVADNIFL